MDKNILRQGLVLIIIFLFFGASVIPSLGRTILKKTSSIDPCSPGYIQELIDSASDGDTIFIPSGTYYENIMIYKSINLIGEDKDTTIIDGNNYENVVYVTADGVNISGFTIQNSGSNEEDTGIYINSDLNTITGNTISFNSVGIYLKQSLKNIITNNTIKLNIEIGIYLSSSSGNTITRNNIFRSIEGIYLFYNSDNNTIKNNTINSNEWVGINFLYSSNNNIKDNIISNNQNGIQLHYSSNNNMLSNNSFSNDGLYIMDSYQNIVTNNIVNDKPLVYFEDKSDITIDYTGQVILINCINITVQNQDLSNIAIGIDLQNSHNCLISDNAITSNNREGLRLYYSSNNTLIGNKISFNYWEAIYLLYSSNNNIQDNTMSTSLEGIYSYRSNNNNIQDNLISANYYAGLYFQKSNNNYLKGNKIKSNNDCGMIFRESSYNNITNNNIISNTLQGINLSRSCIKNIIYQNNFINNGENAYDECNNTWDNGIHGNYWDDFKEKNPDARRIWLKGIWDTSYEIPGGNNKDQYPLIRQWSNSKSRSISRDTTSCNFFFIKFLKYLPLLEVFLRVMSLLR